MNTNKAKTLFVLMVIAVFLLSPDTRNKVLAADSDSSEKPKIFKIVIDPGHGGKAPGAVGPNGEKEKDITLVVGKMLAKRLTEEGFEVFLTREDDVSLPLNERTAFANTKKADLFISIHVNANEAKSTDGVETYFLNLTTDASSKKVAERENAMSPESLQGLTLIIRDLMLNAKINESSRFATSIQNSIISSLRKTGYVGKDHGVKQAPFYVLMGAKMPAILIETGFITNAADCMLLHNDAHLENIIEGITAGIKAYTENTTYVYNNGINKEMNKEKN
ncbi:MAG: N-acetylmuramoyl-L-alanine amidase [Dehalococcoidia bacterium]|jgi:N-acetylmuramoyl-L-alanine amidase